MNYLKLGELDQLIRSTAYFYMLLAFPIDEVSAIGFVNQCSLHQDSVLDQVSRLLKRHNVLGQYVTGYFNSGRYVSEQYVGGLSNCGYKTRFSEGHLNLRFSRDTRGFSSWFSSCFTHPSYSLLRHSQS